MSALSAAEVAALKVAHAAAPAASDEQLSAVVSALGSTQLLQTPEVVAEQEHEVRERIAQVLEARGAAFLPSHPVYPYVAVFAGLARGVEVPPLASGGRAGGLVYSQESARAAGLDVALSVEELAVCAESIVRSWGDRTAEPDDAVGSTADAGAQLARAMPLVLRALTTAQAEVERLRGELTSCSSGGGCEDGGDCPGCGLIDPGGTHDGTCEVAADEKLPPFTTVADPVPLRWGLDNTEWGYDNSVTLLLSGPDREPYVLELDEALAATLWADLAGPDAVGTRPCGHDDYHYGHPWNDRLGIWCPGHYTTADAGGAS